MEYAQMNANSGEGYLACILYDPSASSHNGLVIDQSGSYVLMNSDDIQYVTVYDGVTYEVVRARNGIRLVIDGRQVSFSKTDGLGVPFIYNERTMVPLRKPFEAIGASVSYDPAGRTVTINKDNTEIHVVVGGEIFVNGSAFPLDAPTAPAMIKDGRVYVPVKHIFEALGYSVSWDQATQTVNIDSFN